MTQHDNTNDTLPQSGRAVIYRRAAPRVQTQASQSQRETLIAFANEQGFSNERIIVFEDGYASAKQLPANDFTAPDLAALFRLRSKQAAHYIAEQIGKLTQLGRPQR
jgi:hypothetical protein